MQYFTFVEVAVAASKDCHIAIGSKNKKKIFTCCLESIKHNHITSAATETVKDKVSYISKKQRQILPFCELVHIWSNHALNIKLERLWDTKRVYTTSWQGFQYIVIKYAKIHLALVKAIMYSDLRNDDMEEANEKGKKVAPELID